VWARELRCSTVRIVGQCWHSSQVEFIPGSAELRVSADLIDDLAQMGKIDSAEELHRAWKSRIHEDVASMVDQMGAADAFDLIELMRLREVPISPVLGLDPNFEGSGAALEMVALMLTCRPSRLPADPDRGGAVPPDQLVPDLHERSMRLLRLTVFSALSSARLSDEPLAALAAEYQGNVVNVRTMQYEHLQDKVNAALFNSERLAGVLEQAIGFTYDQFIEVRDAIADLYSDRFIALRDETADIVEKYGSPQGVPEEVRQRFRDAMTDMIILPGQRAQFTVADLATYTQLGENVVRKVLAAFSITFQQRNPGDAISDFLRGDNPFRTAGLVTDGQGNYVMAGSPIGTDALRYVVEDALKSGPKWNTYDKARTFVSESLAIEELEKLLQTEVRYRGLKYWTPKDGIDVNQLGAQCTNLTEIANETECDGLFVIDDLAVCLEVKGRSVADPARRGDVRRLARDLSNIVGSAASQARRLEMLIEVNGGIWLQDRTWLDLEFIREIRSIAVCLDDVGPLAIAMDDLRRADVLKDDKLPWVTSLHDLMAIGEVVVNPAEFLLYVRRRSDSAVAKLFRATDELDLFMLFLSFDHLYVEPDPDQVAQDHPVAPKPTKAARRCFRRSQQLTRIGTHTDPLDAWMYREEGSNPYEADKPAFQANPFVLQLVGELTRRRPEGWLRITADLLAATGESHENLERAIKSVIGSTLRDHQPHTAMQAFAGVWGLPVIIVGSCPLGISTAQALARLTTYMNAKKHQLISDRAACILFDESGQICDFAYDNRTPSDDPELDRVIDEMRLQPPSKQSRSASRSSTTRRAKSPRRRNEPRKRR
jgi:hypothetical protein